MAATPDPGRAVTVFAIAQAGRLEYEAVLLAASLRRADPDRRHRLVLGEPQPGPLWRGDPRVSAPVRELLAGFGAEILPFESRVFGASYPQGNKIEGLSALPEGEPFLFLDTDTLLLAAPAAVPFDFSRPSASMRREGTWPVPELYGPGCTAIWRALYDRFGLHFESSLDLAQPDEYWERYLYFNAGWFFYRCGPSFGRRFLEIAQAIRDAPPPELVLQPLDPWLDQVALPLVIHGFGGGRPASVGIPDGLMDGSVTCHWRALPLLFAREADAVVELVEALAAPNPVKRVLKAYEPFLRLIYQGRGRKARALFDRDRLPRREQAIRNLLKREGLWLR